MNFGYELFPVVSINSGELVFNISYPVSWRKPENEIKPLFKFKVNSGGGGGHLSIFWVGMCRTGLLFGTPF